MAGSSGVNLNVADLGGLSLDDLQGIVSSQEFYRIPEEQRRAVEDEVGRRYLSMSKGRGVPEIAGDALARGAGGTVDNMASGLSMLLPKETRDAAAAGFIERAGAREIERPRYVSQGVLGKEDGAFSSPGNFGAFALESALEQAPNLAAMLLPAGAVGKGLQVAGSTAKAAQGASRVAGLLGGLAMNTGENAQSLYEATGETKPGGALVAGAGYTALDSLFGIEGQMLRRMIRKPAVDVSKDVVLASIKDAVKTGGKEILGEAWTEPAQSQIIGRLTEAYYTKAFTRPGEDWVSVLDDTLTEALGAALGSAVPSALGARADYRRTKADNVALAEVMASGREAGPLLREAAQAREGGRRERDRLARLMGEGREQARLEREYGEAEQAERAGLAGLMGEGREQARLERELAGADGLRAEIGRLESDMREDARRRNQARMAENRAARRPVVEDGTPKFTQETLPEAIDFLSRWVPEQALARLGATGIVELANMPEREQDAWIRANVEPKLATSFTGRRLEGLAGNDEERRAALYAALEGPTSERAAPVRREAGRDFAKEAEGAQRRDRAGITGMLADMDAYADDRRSAYEALGKESPAGATAPVFKAEKPSVEKPEKPAAGQDEGLAALMGDGRERARLERERRREFVPAEAREIPQARAESKPEPSVEELNTTRPVIDYLNKKLDEWEALRPERMGAKYVADFVARFRDSEIAARVKGKVGGKWAAFKIAANKARTIPEMRAAIKKLEEAPAPIVSPIQEAPAKYKPGDRVTHAKHGEGEVKGSRVYLKDGTRKATVKFRTSVEIVPESELERPSAKQEPAPEQGEVVDRDRTLEARRERRKMLAEHGRDFVRSSQDADEFTRLLASKRDGGEPSVYELDRAETMLATWEQERERSNTTPQAPKKNVNGTADEVMAALNKKLQERLAALTKHVNTHMNAGFDTEAVKLGAEVAAVYVEMGVVKFKDFVRRIKADAPQVFAKIKGLLHSIWSATGEVTGAELEDLTKAQAKSIINDVEAESNESEAQDEREPVADNGRPDGDRGRALAGVPAEDDAVAPQGGDAAGEGVRGGKRDVAGDGEPQGPDAGPATGVGNDEGGVSAAPRGKRLGQRKKPGGQRAAKNEAPGEPGNTGVPADKPEGQGGGLGSGSLDAPKTPAAAAVEAVADEAVELTRGDNYVITAEDEEFIGKGSPKERVRNNIAAIRLSKELAESGRAATIDEKRILARFVGWGGVPQVFVPEYENLYNFEKNPNRYNFGRYDYGAQFRGSAAGAALKMDGYELHKEIRSALGEDGYRDAKKSTQNAHYTAIPVIRAMHKALRRMGVAGGRFLEPSAGIGHFIGTADYPGKTEWVGVELDEGTGQILKSLYPDSKTFVQGFETVNVPDGFFDVAVSNVPFGNYTLHDPRYNKHAFLIHDYFFAKSLDKVRPGGVVAFITSAGTMDKQDAKLRHFIGQNGGQFLGAVRLPDNAFAENANTKVVTDIIFIRKLEEGGKADNAAWDGREAVKAGDGEVVVNKYFAEHPEQVLGEFTMKGTMYAGKSMTVTAKDGVDLAAELDAALARVLPEGSYVKKQKADRQDAEQNKAIFDENGLKDGNLDVVGGKLMRKNGELMEPVSFVMPRGSEKVNKEKVVRSMAQLRDALRELVKGQLENCDEGRLTKLQGALNRAYNAFVKEHGPLNRRENEAIIRHDLGDGQRLLALEVWDPKAKKAEKAAIFSSRVITAPGQRAESAGSAVDAYYIALNETGGIDPARMAELTGKPADAILKELEEGGHIFHNPETSAYEQSEDYLSGRVRKKLLAARGAAELDARYARNVAALEKVQPEDVPVEKISFALGQAWIPVNVWADFAEYISGFKCGIIHNAVTNAWQIIPKVSKTEPGRFGTDALKGYRILQALMNGAAIRVSDGDGNVNQVETDKAQEKANKIVEVFPNWLLDDEDRKAELGRLYNDVMNDNVPREWDASRLDIKGLSAKWRGMMDIAGREYQKRAVARGVTGGNLLLAHAVGAGKTVEMASIAMELRRMGLARKPLFVVPNHMLEQWGREFSDAFPAANVLVARKSEMQGDRRKRFTARIANGNWDAVIMAHSTYSKIGMSAKAQAEYVSEELEEIRTAVLAARAAQAESGKKTDSRIVKQLEAMLARAEAKLQKLLANEGKDKVVTFEELGADYLFVDEAHNFKGIAILTKNGRIPGLGQQTSQRAQDMEMKARYISGLHGGKRGVVFATGTPISNSMCEMYVMMRYLAGPELRRLGVWSFDAWASQFGKVVKEIEANPTGKGFRMKERFAQFHNLPEMKAFFRAFSDVVQSKDLKVKRPAVKGGSPVIHEVEPTKRQLDYIDTLVERAEAVAKKEVEPKDDNMLKITNDGRLVAMDPRLVGIEENDAARIAACADSVADIYKRTKSDKATQLVFCDIGIPSEAALREKIELNEEDDEAEDAGQPAGEAEGVAAASGKFNVYSELADLLAKRGVRRSDIAFIHEAKGDEAKAELFAKVRSGEIRVLIGNTPRMGEGTNVQHRLVALHHLDAPWKPAWVEQRNGRIVRPGNMHEEVELHHYVTKQTFDVYMWQTIERKAKFIVQAMDRDDGTRSIEDCDSAPLTYAEIKACATGDPRIVEKFKLERDVDMLKRKIAARRDNEDEERRRVKRLAIRATESRSEYEALVALVERIKPLIPKEFEIIDNQGNKLTGNKEIANYFNLRLTTASKAGANYPLGTYAGMKMMAQGAGQPIMIVVPDIRVSETRSQLENSSEYAFTEKDLISLKGGITRQISPTAIQEMKSYAEDAEKEAAKAAEEFERSETAGLIEQLDAVAERLDSLNKELGIGQDDAQAAAEAAAQDGDQYSVSRKAPDASRATRDGSRADIEAVASAMGVEVEWGDPAEMLGIDGMVKDGRAVLNPDADRGALLRFTFGHEAAHLMEGGQGWAAFLLRLESLVGREAVDKYLADLNRRRDKIGLAPLTKKAALREIAADLVGSRMADARFWNKVKNRNAPLWRKIIDWVKGWIADAAPALPFDAKALFDSPEKFAEAMGEVEKILTQRREGAKGEGEGALSVGKGMSRNQIITETGKLAADVKIKANDYRNTETQTRRLWDLHRALVSFGNDLTNVPNKRNAERGIATYSDKAARDAFDRFSEEVNGERYSLSREDGGGDGTTALGRLFQGFKAARASEPESRDLSPLAVLFGQMAWYSEKIPALKRLFDRAQKARDDRHEIAAKYFGVRGQGESDLNTFIGFMRGGILGKQMSEEGQRLNEYLVRVDRDRDGAHIGQDEKSGLWTVTARNEAGRVETVFSGDSEQAALDAMHDWEAARLMRLGFSLEAAKALRAFRNIHDREYADLVQSYRDHEAELAELGVKPDDEWKDLFAQLRKIGNLRGTYFPRLRLNSGRFILTYEQDGLRYLERFDTVTGRMTREAKVRADGAQNVKKGMTDTPSEDAFDGLQMVSLNDFLKGALNAVERVDGRMDWEAIGLKAKYYEYERKDGGRERHLVIRSADGGEAGKVFAQWFKDAGGRFYETKQTGEGKAWHFIDPTPKDAKRLFTTAARLFYGRSMPAQVFGKLLVGQVARMIEGRGASARKIARNDATGDDVWRGYDEDALRVTVRNANAVAGSRSKGALARDMLKIVSGTDVSWDSFRAANDGLENAEAWEAYEREVEDRRVDSAKQPVAFKEAKSFISEMLRNETGAERVAGWFSGVAALWRLSGFGAAAVNLTSMATTVPAAAHAYAKLPFAETLKRTAGAGADYVRWARAQMTGGASGLDADAQWLFDEIERRGWGDQVFVEDAAAALRNAAGEVVNTLGRTAMFAFGATERFNRASTVAGVYRALAARERGTLSDSRKGELLDEAKRVSDKAHGVYGKVNRPAWARGDSAGALVMRSGYVFKTYAHNLLNLMIDSGVKRRDAKAALWLVAAPSVFGLAASPVAAAAYVVAQVLRGLGGDVPDDPQEMAYAWAREALGDHAERFARSGVMGLVGVDFSGSMSMIPDGDILERPAWELAGAPAGVLADWLAAAALAARGEGYAAAERAAPRVIASKLKAYREWSEGVSTRKGKPVYWGEERIKADALDAFIRAGGLNPSKVSAKRNRQWAEMKAADRVLAEKSELYDAFREWRRKGGTDREEAARLFERVGDYNAMARAHSRNPNVTPITPRSLRQVIGAADRAPAAERRRVRDTRDFDGFSGMSGFEDFEAYMRRSAGRTSGFGRVPLSGMGGGLKGLAGLGHGLGGLRGL